MLRRYLTQKCFKSCRMLNFVTSTKKSKYKNGVLTYKVECKPAFRLFLKINSDISSSES